MINHPLILLATMLWAPVDSAAISTADQHGTDELIAGPDFPIADALEPHIAVAFQVRIEQRIIIRVPRRLSGRVTLSEAPRRIEPATQQYQRRRFGQCLIMSEIAGVQTMPDDRLLLFMRDRRLIEAELARTCRAREFYEGFYMERSEDGRLCVERDLLQARSGGQCEIEQLRQLVPIDPED